MSAPWQAIVALVWAIVGLPWLAYAATRPAKGRLLLHAWLMGFAVLVEVGVVVSFTTLEPHPRRTALAQLPFFRIHLAFAIGSLIGMAWQLVSRTSPRLRPLHRVTGPYVVLIWSLALLTGIYNYFFLYVLAP